MSKRASRPSNEIEGHRSSPVVTVGRSTSPRTTIGATRFELLNGGLVTEGKISTDAVTGTSVAVSLAPMPSVRNGARAVEFYKSAFGAIEVHRVEDPGGSVVSRLSIDGAEFWLADVP